MQAWEYLTSLMGPTDRDRAAALSHHLLKFIDDSARLCQPERIRIFGDSASDVDEVRRMALRTGEEFQLAIDGHTCHFDGYFDLARDTGNTRYLVPPGEYLDPTLNQLEREAGLNEMHRLLRGSMAGKDMIVQFRSLGPVGSTFSMLALQITDSYYVAHSTNILYRSAYRVFVDSETLGPVLRVLHSAGRTENGVSADVAHRRVYIDLLDETVYSVNNQYAGNSLGLKKLAFRLAIRRAHREGWLAEHMFLMGVHGPGGRKAYFAGAFPSACGKTSTCMVPGESVIGDDISYIRNVGGVTRAVNVEQGIFGIIHGVSEAHDPIIFRALMTPGEVIFSNVLVHDGTPYWLGDGREHPSSGRNFAGAWRPGLKGPDGAEVPLAHENARYTMGLSKLDNVDPEFNSPQGVPLSAILYGGRDSDTNVPLREAFDWQHGVITIGACLESQTTSATIGKKGVRAFQPFANIDFISIPLGRYILDHLKFGAGLTRPPSIFGVNYFLIDSEGRYLNSREDKRVWLKWMERRIAGEMDAIRSPVGYLPLYSDLRSLFRVVLAKDYSHADYEIQFSVRIARLLERNERMRTIYSNIREVPRELFLELDAERERLLRARDMYGDLASPESFV
ncbi:MAG: phosphoenolpyruvate carboxykinase (GTP) [Candidatus Thorarchaeota archaeon]